MNTENKVGRREWEKWKNDVYKHITNPDSETGFNSVDSTLLKDPEQVNEMLEVLDMISYGGFGEYAIKVRRGENFEYPTEKVIGTGIVELEVGMGQRNRKICDPIAISVYGTSEYIPWPDGQPKFELGKKGNKVVNLNLIDLSRAVPDSVIE